jgi:hypothetical protein
MTSYIIRRGWSINPSWSYLGTFIELNADSFNFQERNPVE